jgi:hypothetical protein
MSLRNRATYEVASDYLELVSPSGHKHWLGRGAELPEWVEPGVIEDLVNRRAVDVFEVLRNV